MTESGGAPPDGWPGMAFREIKQTCPSCAHAEKVLIEAEAWRNLFINLLQTLRQVSSITSMHNLVDKAIEIVVKPEGVSKVFTLPCEACFGHGHVMTVPLLDGEEAEGVPCKKCAGTGYIKARIYFEGFKNAHPYRYCPECKGEGFTGDNMEWMECHPCNGLGCVHECPLCKGGGCVKCGDKGFYAVDYP